MGFLDHSTNNIIIDAVLTDTGRQFLSRNDGSFSIVKFAFGDDEIDYSIIEKFGRTVGKEKIEKNTPVFEAQTNGNYALKHRLMSISNPTLIRVPRIEITALGFADATLSMKSSGATSSRTLLLQQQLTGESNIDVELQDQAFIVKVPNRFLQIKGTTPDNVDSDAVATYIMTRDADSNPDGGSKLTLTLETKSITQSQFAVYGNALQKSVISAVVSIAGIQSGAVIEFNTKISSV